MLSAVSKVNNVHKAWRNWPTLLAKHYCFRLKSGVVFFAFFNDSETNNSDGQALLANFGKALMHFSCFIFGEDEVNFLLWSGLMELIFPIVSLVF